MARLLPALLSFALLALALAAEKKDPAVVLYNSDFPMAMYRLCAAFHNEGCSPQSDPPGPCLDPRDCMHVVCDDPRLDGSCAKDMSLDFCKEATCPFYVRQQNNPVANLGALFGR